MKPDRVPREILATWLQVNKLKRITVITGETTSIPQKGKGLGADTTLANGFSFTFRGKRK